MVSSDIILLNHANLLVENYVYDKVFKQITLKLIGTYYEI
jgi:hypothetical protein